LSTKILLKPKPHHLF